MPGQITVTKTAPLRTLLVSAEFSAADEDTLVANGGKWPSGYLPQTILRLRSNAGESSPGNQPSTIQVGPGSAEMDAALLADYKEAVKEFFTMPAAHTLVGRIMRGEYPDRAGVYGGDAWRERFAGAEYNMHDGSGDFVITAPEKKETQNGRP